MPITLNESKFDALKAKLRELFELDKSNLDFGIYRIMAAKNKDVTEFLERQLKDVVRHTLTAHGAGAADQVQVELDQAIAQARQLGADPETLPKVKELKAKLAAAGGASAAELEADIYNHLLNFFNRYYDEGDFISKRRYKGDVYSIPYAGEEVTLHWANKDQYYIKSGEWHKDYRFKVGDKSVRFKLVEATQETNNNKESDDAKRRYILDAEMPVEVSDAELALRFQFRVPKDAEKKAVVEAESTRIFGGKYDVNSGRSKGDECEQFCADAERRTLAAIPAEWRARVTAPAATEGKPARTVLGKHLDDFTARNTFDYFIHKDLGGFLTRELDFYIKNEVVRLDDLESLPADHLTRVQGKVKAIRTVAGRVILFLATLENFQRKMWLKKKLVLNTNWLVTIDRVPAALRGAVAKNPAQWTEWEALGFKPAAETGLIQGPPWGTQEYLDGNDKLVVDTRLFDRAFTAELMASDEVLCGAGSLDQATSGTLVHSENFQALNFMMRRFLTQIKCVTIDPPYNRLGDGFPYKDNFRHGSWLSLMNDRIALAWAYLRIDGAIFSNIDENERDSLQAVLDISFGRENRVEELIWAQNTTHSQSPLYSTNHEYIEVYARDRATSEKDSTMFREPKPGYSEVNDLIAGFGNSFPKIVDVESALKALFDKHLEEYKSELREQGLEYDEDTKKQDPWRGIYPYSSVEYRNSKGEWVSEDTAQSVGAKLWVYRESDTSAPAQKQSDSTRDPKDPNYRFYRPLHPKTGMECPHPKRGWGFPFEWPDNTRDSFVKYDAAKRIIWGVDDRKIPQFKRFLHEVETNVSKSVFHDYTDGEKQIAALFGETGLFPTPKPTTLPIRFVSQTSGKNDHILDFFGGSGTTGHSVLSLNRVDNGARKFILVEMGAHFNSILRPRIAKVIYSNDWKDGKAQTHGKGSSALVKYFTLESYEDALNNLPAPTGELLAGSDPVTRDALLTYSLDLEMGPHLLNADAFRDPWGYSIHAQPAGEAEIRKHPVDLVETFNYLLGLKVKAYGPMERYAADFTRAKHAEKLGQLKLSGRLRRAANGPFVFQRVEGELLDGTRVLVVWRKLTADAEQDAAVLDAWMDRHREDTKERTEHREYHQIYINGPVTLPQPTQEIRTVFPIEQTFKDRMFADTGDASVGGAGNV